MEFDNAAFWYVYGLDFVRPRSRFGRRRHLLQGATARIVEVGEQVPQSVGAIGAARGARGRKPMCWGVAFAAELRVEYVVASFSLTLLAGEPGV